MENNNNIPDYYSKIVEIFKKNNWFGIVWFGHFSKCFYICENTEKKVKPGVYQAMFEQFYDAIGDNKELYKVELKENDSLKEVYDYVVCFSHKNSYHEL